MMKVPGKKACAEAVELESALQCRSWEADRYYVYNSIQMKKKNKEVNDFCRRPQKGQ